MYIIATALFVIGISAGGLWGYYKELTIIGTAFCAALGGFAGSAAGAMLFTYLYFTGRDDPAEEEDIDTSGPAHKQSLLIENTTSDNRKVLNRTVPQKESRAMGGLKKAVRSILKKRGA